MVRVLSRRTPFAVAAGEDQPRSGVRPRLQGQARPGAGVARPERRSIHELDRRPRWARGHRLRRLRRAGNLLDRQGRCHSLQADRAADPRGVERKDPAARAGTAEVIRRLERTVCVAVLAAACLVAGVAAMSQPAGDLALDARLKKLESELRCLVCQKQTLADSNADLAADLRREVRELALAG